MNTIKLHFTPDDSTRPACIGNGNTITAALASLESHVIETYGLSATFDTNLEYQRDLFDIFEILHENDGIYHVYDFSNPENSFSISRQPLSR